MIDLIEKIMGLIGFDEPDKRFELKETEPGQPGGAFKAARRVIRGQSRTPLKLSSSLEANEKLFERLFRSETNSDAVLRRFETAGETELLLVYVSGMADENRINGCVLKPLMEYKAAAADIRELVSRAVNVGEVRFESEPERIAADIAEGFAALFMKGERLCAVLETHGFEKRPVSAAENEKVVLGPKESFTEALKTNVTLIRRIIRSRDLTVEPRTLKGANGARVALIRREGYTNPSLVDEVWERLDSVETSIPLTSGILEQLLEGGGFFPLPRILSTERPDRAAAHIMQGRVCLLVEGSPFALIMPATLFSLMNSPEDVYLRPPLGTVLRLVRYTGALVSVLLPGYFLALALYHQGILTAEVLSTVIASRRMVFEPIGVEMLLLLVIFQMIREAGQRVPGSIGQAIGIIGGLIMGQAAVTAHIASSVVLIIVAASGLGNFCIPDYSTQIAASWARLAMLFAAWLGGLAAMVSAIMLMLCLLAGAKSFGVPFLAPYSPKARRRGGAVLRGRIMNGPSVDDISNTVAEGGGR